MSGKPAKSPKGVKRRIGSTLPPSATGVVRGKGRRPNRSSPLFNTHRKRLIEAGVPAKMPTLPNLEDVLNLSQAGVFDEAMRCFVHLDVCKFEWRDQPWAAQYCILLRAHLFDIIDRRFNSKIAQVEDMLYGQVPHVLPLQQGWKLVRNIAVPRIDPSDPSSNFGLWVHKSDPKAKHPHSIIKKVENSLVSSSSDGGENVPKDGDIIVAVNGRLVFIVGVMEARRSGEFKDVLRHVKSTNPGHPLRLDILRRCSTTSTEEPFGGDKSKADQSEKGPKEMDVAVKKKSKMSGTKRRGGGDIGGDNNVSPKNQPKGPGWMSKVDRSDKAVIQRNAALANVQRRQARAKSVARTASKPAQTSPTKTVNISPSDTTDTAEDTDETNRPRKRKVRKIVGKIQTLNSDCSDENSVTSSSSEEEYCEEDSVASSSEEEEFDSDDDLEIELKAKDGREKTATSTKKKRARVLSKDVHIIGSDEVYLQSLGVTCPCVRAHFDAAASQIHPIIEKLVLNPNSKIIGDLPPGRNDRSVKVSLIYAVFDRKTGKLLKIGMTSNLKLRCELKYDKKDVIVKSIFNFDGMPPEMDAKVRAILNNFFDTVIDDDKADDFSRRLFRMIVEDGAGRMGMDKIFALALCERACQIKYGGAGQVCEVIMNDVSAREEREKDVRAFASILAPILDDIFGPDWGEVELRAVASWATALYPDRRSSKVDAMKILVGDNWVDTIPRVLCPNPQNMDEAYGKIARAFTPEDRADGRGVMDSELSRAGDADSRAGKPIALFVDTNEDTCYSDRKDLEDLIEKKYGFRRVVEAFGDEIVVFTKKSARAVVVLHPPLSVAGDARTEIGVMKQVARGRTLAALEIIARYVRGEGLDAELLALEAAARVEVVLRGFHMNFRHGAVLFRHTVTDSSINAITESNLTLTPPSRTYPLAWRARYGTGDSPESRAEHNDTSRVINSRILFEGLSLLSRADDDINTCMAQLNALFGLGGVTNQSKYARWYLFLASFKVGSDTLRLLQRKRDALTANPGNPNAANTPKEIVQENDKIFIEIQNLGASSVEDNDTAYFWLIDRRQAIPNHVPDELESPRHGKTFPVFRMKYSLLQTRLATEKNPKGNTKANKAIRWHDLDAGSPRTKRSLFTHKIIDQNGQPSYRYPDPKNGPYVLCWLKQESMTAEK